MRIIFLIKSHDFDNYVLDTACVVLERDTLSVVMRRGPDI